MNNENTDKAPNMSRRAFLQTAGTGALVAIMALTTPIDSYAQAATQPATQPAAPKQPLRAEMEREGKKPELRFDIRALRREMGEPAGTGPYVPVIMRARKNLNVNEWTYYEAIIDAGLLQVVTLNEQEIQAEEKARGITLPRNVPIRQARETVAFVAQMNIEIYMTPAQMREHIQDYRNMKDDATLIRMRDSWRDDIRLNKANTTTLSAVTDHLITWHGFEKVSSSGVPLLRAVIEAKDESKYVIQGRKPQAALNTTPRRDFMLPGEQAPETALA
jgi:hypothetical protein